jgi:hypothetical protein
MRRIEMTIEKAALFVDNSNIFKGLYSYSRHLTRTGGLKEGQYLRMRWEKLIEKLEAQDGGLDIYARHFFASLPPAADVSKLKHRPTEEEWEEMVKKSAQTGFYKVIQDPPFGFTLHAVPLRFTEIRCGRRMRQAYYKCVDASEGKLQCKLSLDPDECRDCRKKFLFKYEKGVDVALAAQLVIFGGASPTRLDRIILVAGDGDYKEAIRFVRQRVGRDIQIVSWRRALSNELEKLSNRPTIFLDEHWKTLCEVRERPPLEEIPAADEEVVQEDNE